MFVFTPGLLQAAAAGGVRLTSRVSYPLLASSICRPARVSFSRKNAW